MKTLSELPTYEPDKVPGRVRYAVEVREQKSAQILVITSREPLVAYQLDIENDKTRKALWKEKEKHPDSVVIGRLGERSFVCFIELKANMRPKPDKAEPGKDDKRKLAPAEYTFEQLEGGIRHFHPFGATGGPRGHGDDHHDAWRSGADALEVLPDADHEVVGVAVGFRQVPRPPPVASLLQLGNKKVMRVVVPIHGSQAHRAEIAFDDLLRRAGILR